MPISPDGILEAVFDPQWAAVRLVVDGGMWPSPVASLTIVRSVPGAADLPVRGVDRRPAVGGYFVGTDLEVDLEVPVTYTVTGYSAAGAVVATSSVVTSTAGARPGLWVKVPGSPDLTCRVRLREVGELVEDTVGGNYRIAGSGGMVAQAAAHADGTGPESGTVSLSVPTGPDVDRLRAALRTRGRVLLLQPVGSSDLDAGYYLVTSSRRANPAQAEAYPNRWFTLAVERTSMPAGEGQGVPGVTWAAVTDTYPTWSAVQAAKSSWFDLMQEVG